jgi:hypothetical protein
MFLSFSNSILTVELEYFLLSFNSGEVMTTEKLNTAGPTRTSDPLADLSDFSLNLAIKAREEYFQKLKAIKCLLIFDKSKITTDVHCLVVNPCDNVSLLRNSVFKISMRPLKNLLYYRYKLDI